MLCFIYTETCAFKELSVKSVRLMISLLNLNAENINLPRRSPSVCCC